MLFKKNLYRVKKKIEKYNYRRTIYRITHLFDNKNGIEIGGTTRLFSSPELPLYSVIKNLDGCNFSNITIWEGTIEEGSNYNFYKNKTGYQYIREASDLKNIESEKYDFLLASHCLEHCANALKTVAEWLRVIKPGGYILLILPDKNKTFDHKRQVTSFDHLLKDFQNNVSENDLTHLEEILLLHDLSMDLPAGDFQNFKKRSLNNIENRGLHHHVFDFELLEMIFKYFKVQVKYKIFIKPNNLVITGRK